MAREFPEETDAWKDEDRPLGPCFDRSAITRGRGVRTSRSYETTSASLSKRGSNEVDTRGAGNRSGTLARGSTQVTEELDQKWADAVDKFKCESCEGFIKDNAMVFVLENENVICSKCMVVARPKTLNTKSRSMSQMMLKKGQNGALLIRDAKQIAQAVVRAGDFRNKRNKRRSLPVKGSNEDSEHKNGPDDWGEDDKVRAPVYTAHTRRQAPRTLGADCTLLRRKVRRASEPLSPIRPKFDNILMETSWLSEKL